jgi:hypothetical protein
MLRKLTRLARKASAGTIGGVAAFLHWPEKVPELSFQLGEEVENAFFRI